MDMFDSESFDSKLNFNEEVSVAKGEWLYLEMNLRTIVHQGKFLTFFGKQANIYLIRVKKNSIFLKK